LFAAVPVTLKRVQAGMMRLKEVLTTGEDIL
jgi:hypothetical protein